MNVLTTSLFLIVSLHCAYGQNANDGYFEMLKNAAKMFQQPDQNNQMQDFIAKSLLSSIFPQMNEKNMAEILQNIKGVISSMPQVNGTNILNDVFEGLKSSSLFKKLSPGFMQQIMNLIKNERLNLTNVKDVSGVIQNLLKNLNIDTTSFGNNSIPQALLGFMFQNNSSAKLVSGACVNDMKLLLSGLLSQKEWALRSKFI